MHKITLALLIILTSFGCNSLSKQESKEKILFVVSNQHTYGNTERNTSNHFAEIVLAYEVFRKANYKVEFVSPEGGAIPIGYIKTSDTIQKKYLYDSHFMALLKNTYQPKAIDPSTYVAVYYSGGGAAMFGIPENVDIQNISRKIYENKGVVSAICHGTAGIVHLKTSNGKYIYEGKQINGFPDKFEKKTADYYKTFPFSIEQTINGNGGIFTFSEKGWDGFYRVDGRLITGQDPSASASVARQVIKVLKNKL